MLSVRQPFGEHSENSRRTLDECSPPEWNGKEGSGHGAGNENHIAQPASLPPAPSADCPESGHVLNWDCVEPDAGKQSPLLATPSPAKQGRAINPGAARFKARFDEFWDTFDYKHGKTRAMKTWMAVGGAAGRDADLDALATEILRVAEIEATRRPVLVAMGRTPIYPEGWLSQRRWEDEGLLSWGKWSPAEQAFVDVFNANIGDVCPKVEHWTEKRSELTKVAAEGKLTLEKWAGFWRYVRDQCEFSFPVSYEWFLRRENFAAVADGHYNKDRRVA